jgi:hypothetical protein
LVRLQQAKSVAVGSRTFEFGGGATPATPHGFSASDCAEVRGREVVLVVHPQNLIRQSKKEKVHLLPTPIADFSTYHLSYGSNV